MGLFDLFKKEKEGEMRFELEKRGNEKVAILVDIGNTEEEIVEIPYPYKGKYIVKTMRPGAIKDKHNLRVLKVPPQFSLSQENGPVGCENLERIEAPVGCTLNNGKAYISFGYLSYIVPGYKGSINDDKNYIEHIREGVFDGPYQIKKLKLGNRIRDFDINEVLAAQPGIQIEISPDNPNFKTEDDVIYATPINQKRRLFWAGPNGVVTVDPKKPNVVTREDLKSMEGIHFKRLEIKYPVKIIETDAIQNMECEEIRISPDAEIIKSRAIHGCPGVKKIILGPRTGIEETAFYDLPKLEAFQYEFTSKYDRNTTDELGVMFHENGTILYKFPDGRKLDKYEIPPTVEKIATFAFAGADIKELKFNQAVGLIGFGAFANAHIEKMDAMFSKAIFTEGSCANMRGPIESFMFDSGVSIRAGAFANTKVNFARFAEFSYSLNQSASRTNNETLFENLQVTSKDQLNDYFKKHK